MINNIKIDPEFENKIPPLTEMELKQLEENILNDGTVINPLIIWNGILIDGHNRYRIIEKYPQITYTVHEKDFPDRFSAIAWICKNQLGRRNLTLEQKKYLIGKQYEAEKLTITNINGINQHTNEVGGQNDHQPKHEKTRERIAKEHNVSDSYVRRAEHFAKGVDIAEESIPGIRQEILTGKIKPTDKEITAIAQATPEKRPELIKQLNQPKTKNNKTEKAIIREISEKMENPDIENKPEDLLCELEDALDTLIFRWNMCIGIHKENFEICKNKIDELADIGIDYLKKIKGGY